MVRDLICGASKTEKVTEGRKSAILPNCCCLLVITVLFDPPWYIVLFEKRKIPYPSLTRIIKAKKFS